MWTFSKNWKFFWWECSGILISSSKKVQSKKTSVLTYKKPNFEKQWMFWSLRVFQSSFSLCKGSILCKRDKKSAKFLAVSWINRWHFWKVISALKFEIFLILRQMNIGRVIALRSIALRSVLTNDTLAVHILMSTGASLRDTKGQKITHEASTWNAVPAASILSSTKYFSSWMAQQKVFWFIPSSGAHQAAARRSRKPIKYRHEGWYQRSNSDPDRLGKIQLQ